MDNYEGKTPLQIFDEMMKSQDPHHGTFTITFPESHIAINLLGEEVAFTSAGAALLYQLAEMRRAMDVCDTLDDLYESGVVDGLEDEIAQGVLAGLAKKQGPALRALLNAAGLER